MNQQRAQHHATSPYPDALLHSPHTLTHLHLYDRHITSLSSIPNLALCTHLTDLSLHANRLTALNPAPSHPLHSLASTLTALDLSSNHITHIHGLDSLVRLIRLDLASNAVRAIAGLQSNRALVRLSLAYNDVDSLEGLVGGCCAGSIEVLDLRGNAIGTMRELHWLKGCVALQELWLADAEDEAGGAGSGGGNAVCRSASYVATVLTCVPSLRRLDGVDVTDAMRATAGGPLSTITHPTFTTPAAPLTALAQPVQSPQPALTPLPTPRIDRLLATHHRRQQQRELVQALHVDHRLEAIERRLATLNRRTDADGVEQRPVRAVGTSSALRDDGGDGVEEDGSEQREDEESVRHVSQRRAETAKRKQPSPPDPATKPEQTQTDPASPAPHSPTQQPSPPPLPSYEQLQQQMLQLRAELSTARDEQRTERQAVDASQRGLEDRLTEAEGQLEAQVGVAVERLKERDVHEAEARKWRDECSQLSSQHHQALEESRRREADARSRAEQERQLRAEAEKQWQDRIEQMRQQLSTAQTEADRMRAERDTVEAETRRLQADRDKADREAKDSEQREQKLTADIAALSQQVKQLQAQSSELQQQMRQAKEAEVVSTERLARDRLLWDEDRRQLTDKLTGSEQRLTALSSHYVDKQRDVSDLKELIKLSVRNEREARREADEAQDEVRRRDERITAMQRQWQRERDEWQQERDMMGQRMQANQSEQQAAVDSRAKLQSAQAELDELRKQTSKLVEEKQQLEQQLAVAQHTHTTHTTTQSTELTTLQHDLHLQTQLCQDHTHSLAAAQQQLRAARAQLAGAADRERELGRQVGYLEEQRGELARVVEAGEVQAVEWREKDKERKWLRKQLDELQEAQQQQAQQLRDKEQALSYVEREVRQLQHSFDTTQQQHRDALHSLTAQLQSKDAEAGVLGRAVDELQRGLAVKEREVRECVERVRVAEARVLSVEGEMRYLLNEMASRQKLANQLAQTLTILP